MIRNHLTILSHLARVDGELEEKEKSLIYALGKKYGLNEDEITGIIENPPPFKIDSFTLLDRFEQFGNVIEMVLADEKIQERELKFCAKLAKKMGVQDIMIQILIKLFTKGKYTQEEREEVRKEVFPFNQRPLNG
jgi:uncharacterized tellurite resistance protein B-like protein